MLVLSTICGVITDNESNLYGGPRGEYIEDLATDEFPDPHWEADLLVTMSETEATAATLSWTDTSDEIPKRTPAPWDRYRVVKTRQPMHEGHDDAATEIVPAGEPSDEPQRYGAIEMDRGEVVIYDREEASAWLQSDLAVAIEA